MTPVPNVSLQPHSVASSPQSNQFRLQFWSMGLLQRQFSAQKALLQQFQCGGGEQAMETANENPILHPVKVKQILQASGRFVFHQVFYKIMLRDG